MDFKLSTKVQACSCVTDDLVSMIVPAYNCQQTIEQCVESLIAQTYPNCEIIVIDDGSTDDTSVILQKYGHKIRYIYQENGGVSVARNRGIHEAAGKYIVFCDSDDYVSETYVEDMLKCAEENHLVISGHTKIETDLGTSDNKPELSEDASEEQILKYLLEEYYLQGPCCKLFFKDILSAHGLSFDTTMNFGEDFHFVLRYLSFINGIVYVNKRNYYYRVSPAGLTASISSQKVHSFIALNEAIIQFADNNPDIKQVVYEYLYYQTTVDYLWLCSWSFRNSLKMGITSRKAMRKSNIIRESVRKCYHEKLNPKARLLLKWDNSIMWMGYGLLEKVKTGIRG